MGRAKDRRGAAAGENGGAPLRDGVRAGRPVGAPAASEDASPKRRRARNEEERGRKLAAILDAALDVFSDKGFAEARLDEIAARAGVAKGTVYLYVSSKQD